MVQAVIPSLDPSRCAVEASSSGIGCDLVDIAFSLDIYWGGPCLCLFLDMNVFIWASFPLDNLFKVSSKHGKASMSVYGVYLRTSVESS